MQHADIPKRNAALLIAAHKPLPKSGQQKKKDVSDLHEYASSLP
jgi:hypothetical protein